MRSFVPFAVLIALLTGSSRARADNLDAGLATHAPEILKYLRGRDCTSVGVFKFRVKKGNQPASLRAAPLNTSLASRLETALTLANARDKPIPIIGDADRIAVEKRLPSYATAEGRRRLFETSFPLAYGNTAVKPHTFLTGQVTVTADNKTATVLIEAFDRNATQMDKVLAFSLPVDRSLLSDLGQSFQLSRSVLKKKRSFEELEEAASENATERDQSGQAPVAPTSGPGASPPPASVSPGEKLIDLEILYDEQRQTVAPDPGSGGELQVAEPRQGQKVKIAFKNVSQETLGVVVMVNGISSNRMQQDEPIHCRKWLPGPGERYVLEGFQLDEKTVQPWRVASDAESAALTFSHELGLISVYVFRSGKELAHISVPKNNDEELPPPPGMSISRSANLRTGSRAGASRSAKPATFAEFQNALEQKTGLVLRPGPKKRGVITQGEGTIVDPVLQSSLPNPVLVMTTHVRYFKPKGK